MMEAHLFILQPKNTLTECFQCQELVFLGIFYNFNILINLKYFIINKLKIGGQISNSYYPSISADGSLGTFQSSTNGIVPSDVNSFYDIFIVSFFMIFFLFILLNFNLFPIYNRKTLQVKKL